MSYNEELQTNNATLETILAKIENLPQAPKCKIYEINIPKSSGWVMLTELGADVLKHINDDNLVVTLVRIGTYSHIEYSGNMFLVTNRPRGYNGQYPAYGMCNRDLTTTQMNVTPIYYPANNTDTSTGLGGNGMFRIADNNYYLKPSDGFIAGGLYLLTFTW